METETLKKEIERVEKNSKDWWASMKENVDDIKEKIEKLPDTIIERMKENIELKIQVCVQALRIEMLDEQKKTYKWIVGLTIGLIISLIGVIYASIKGAGA